MQASSSNVEENTLTLCWQPDQVQYIEFKGARYASVNEIPDLLARREVTRFLDSQREWQKGAAVAAPPAWFPFVFLGVGLIMLSVGVALWYLAADWMFSAFSTLFGMIFMAVGARLFLSHQAHKKLDKAAQIFTLTMKTPEQNMRPGAFSGGGFLGPDESLAAVLAADQATLAELNLTPTQFFEALSHIMQAVFTQRMELTRANTDKLPPHRQETAPLHLFRPNATSIPLDHLPDPNLGYIVEEHFQVFLTVYRGSQACPWGCTVSEGFFDFWILNRRTGDFVFGPGLIGHLIKDHQFFEGMKSPYRVDPVRLATTLALVESPGFKSNSA